MVAIALVLTSDHQDAKAVWAIFGPAVGWSFIGTGLYAWRQRPESRTGLLMIVESAASFVVSEALANVVAALDGTLSLDSPAGRGTRLHAEIPVPPANAAVRGSAA